MRTIKYYLILTCILNSSCNEGEFLRVPKHIAELEVKSIKFSRGFAIANDSIIFSTNYFRNNSYKIENSLEGNLLIGDIILNPKGSQHYIDVIKNKTNDTIRYYSPEFKNKK